MKKRISFDYAEESGLTIATLKTGKGNFFGTSNKHPDDTFPSSYSVGTTIAEARANINYLNRQIADKKIELKGLKRLLAAMPEEATNRHYAVNLAKAINLELDDLKNYKGFWKAVINDAIEARGIYLRSRSMSKEEKEKMRNTIRDSLAALGQNNSKEE